MVNEQYSLCPTADNMAETAQVQIEESSVLTCPISTAAFSTVSSEGDAMEVQAPIADATQRAETLKGKGC